ncbi:squalene/phytoene synthase family protein [Jannaschia rubra]|nr:squalene/phytoene synthase family protein [Jannaschia rubra]
MSVDDDLTACAGLVQRGDPARFRAVMAAPMLLRRMLFPLYAFNLEVARAPWVTKEPLIAEMRLQWWRDALEEIAEGTTVRRHEVVTPLAAAIDATAARDLDDLIDARRADIEGPRFADRDDLMRYLDRTAGTLLWTGARMAGAADEAAVRDAGVAQGIVAWLRAGPDLVEKGRQPLPPGDPAEVVRDLAARGRAALQRFRASPPPRQARPVFLVLSDTDAELRALVSDPGAPPAVNPAASRLRLGWRVLTGRV